MPARLDVLAGVALLVVSLTRLGDHVGPLAAAAFGLALLAGGCIVYGQGWSCPSPSR